MTIAAFICFLILIAGWFMAPGTKPAESIKQSVPQTQEFTVTVTP